MINFRDFLAYDAETGLFTWIGGDARRVGKQAGSIWPKGYVVIEIEGKRYRAHVVAHWFLTGEWIPGRVDHADRNRANNRKTNLRKAGASQQMANRKTSSKNKLGLKGVSQQSPGSYRSTIVVGGNRRHLGSFPSAKLAHDRYAVEAEKCFGDFACAG